ncbi:MAG: thioredoxin family protein [Planctomycetaceae bacterium]
MNILMSIRTGHPCRTAFPGRRCEFRDGLERPSYVRFLYCRLVGPLLVSAMLAGCADEQTADVPSLPVMVSELTPAQPEASVREVNRDELQQLISSSERPVLVEFSVLSGCYRCDDMRSPIRQKAAELQQQADVVRIDFNLNQKLAREVGATVCPSYVVYSKGQVASVRTWPTSADFVADDVQLAVAALKSDSAASAEGRSQ